MLVSSAIFRRCLVIVFAFLSTSCMQKKNETDSKQKGLTDAQSGVHVFAVEFTGVDDVETVEVTESETLICFYTASFTGGNTDIKSAKRVEGFLSPVKKNQFNDSLRTEIKNARYANTATAAICAIAGLAISASIWNNHPITSAVEQFAALWGGAIFLTQKFLERLGNLKPDKSLSGLSALTATPYLVSIVLPVVAVPLAAFVNDSAKSEVFEKMIKQGVFVETEIQNNPMIEESLYKHFRLTVAGFIKTLQGIQEKIALTNYECSETLNPKND